MIPGYRDTGIPLPPVNVPKFRATIVGFIGIRTAPAEGHTQTRTILKRTERLPAFPRQPSLTIWPALSCRDFS